MVTASELEEINEAIHILKCIESVSRTGEKYIIASKVIPIMNCLKLSLQDIRSVTTLGESIKQQTVEELKKKVWPY